jgi:protein-S-isoprenylcysteine O-methyltransferase Ste14
LSLFWRALLAFLALPTIVAGVIPWFFLRPAASRFVAAGLPLIVLGVALLLWCVREFYVAGKGTLAPWDPPRHLVTTGPYRYSRNPMYVAVLIILAGWAVCLDIQTSRAPVYYAAFVAVAFHLRVLFFEEPWAARTFGAVWQEYVARVPRWLVGRRR